MRGVVSVALVLAVALSSAALATGVVGGGEGASSGPAASPSEPRLDAGSVSPGARRGDRPPARRGRPVVVEALPPGGSRESASGDDSEPPDRVLAENARLRGELKHLKALERERGRVATLLRHAAAVYGPVVQGSGELVWPVAGSVVSPFGQRWGRLHAGIDIAGRAGTVIYAAQDGVVVIRGPTGGYGNYVCLQHTRRFTTCYAHLSRFMTRKGKVVSQGEPIGLVGCTGHCFGDHLHFETWVGGRPTDPMRFL
jgi:murein DD-endopeptidase MepM/ murein hydrolase activator NlpD